MTKTAGTASARAALCAPLLLLLGSLSAPAAARGQSPRPQPRVLVEEVVIEGNRRLPDEELLKHVRSRHGRPYDGRRALDDLRALLDTGLFDTTGTRLTVAEGRRGGKALVFLVVELPLVDRLKLEGLPRGVGEAEALRAARAKGRGLKAGGPFDPPAMRRALDGVRALLAARGLTGFSAEGRVDEMRMGHVSVVIEFKESRYD